MLTFDEQWLEAGETVICFGDSLTEATPGYVGILEERLGARGITVIRSGLGGDKTTTALLRLQSDVISRKPDAVSIMLGVNDAVVGRGRWADQPRISPCTYGDNLRWMIHLCRLSGIEKFSISTPYLRPEGHQFLDFGGAMAPYCVAAREAADDMQARLVPVDAVFAEEWIKHPGHTGLLLTVDGIHLTDAGNQLVANAMLRSWSLD